ncbi:unannotated protein [freshwater metagenome]|uniref:Unannotated protein n=1 Tax=freshwater metagenome TaxID=449393 RepID=A0A6J6KD20_9ZZZZ
MVNKLVCTKDEVINGLVVGEAIHDNLCTSESCCEVGGHCEACGLKDRGGLGGTVPGCDVVSGLLEVCGHTATHGSHTQIRDLRHLSLLFLCHMALPDKNCSTTAHND